MTVRGAGDRIRQEVTSWPGISSGPHQFGAIEYTIGKRQIGHVHGDSVVDVPFPKRIRDDLIARGEAEVHRFVPDSGWVTFEISSEKDVEHAIALLRQSYHIAVDHRDAARRTREPTNQ